ncbi:MAG: family 78 glycoside hydrolase catalytic domain [Janthinobacterium lividum]
MLAFRPRFVVWLPVVRRAVLFGAGWLLGPPAAPAQGPGAPVGLRCEYLTNPLGLDAPRPRLTWRLADARRGAAQTAYQLTVGPDSLAVARGGAPAWTSGKVRSGQQLVAYAGPALRPFTKYFWRVQAWDQAGAGAPASRVASFETGLLDQKNWQGTWISDTRDVNLKPAPYFRTTFEVPGALKAARAYIAVGGLYELYLNGRKVGNHRLDPMYTRFDRRTLYVTYDVTPYLRPGKNAVGVLLGNGWYNHQSTAVWYFHEAPWRNRPAFCLDLRLTRADGTVTTVTSGTDWKTALGPLVFNSIYTAEHYDARREQPGWNTVAFNDSLWRPVMARAAPSGHIVAQALEPIRNVEPVPAKTVARLNDTTYVFDLGRNIAGVSQLRARGPAGTVLRLKHGERLYPNGRVDQSNIDVHYRPTDQSDPFQTDLFTLGGRGEETFMPLFNYKGFQYVEVTSSRPVALTAGSLTGYFMHSDVAPVGQVSSSNPTIDKIWRATNNSYLSNLFGYPTDCPQREKNGWTGDAHIASETGLYNFDGITVYEKWLADHRDEQQPNGVLPSIIPSDGWGYEWGNGPDWTSTIAIIPWNIYLFYGDAKLLADCYGNLKRYVDHIDAISPNGLTAWGLGDWVPVKSKSPVELTSSVYYFADASILAQAAQLLGHPADHARYAALAQKVRAAINAKYLNRQTNLYGNGVQTELSVPLYWGVVPDELREKVAANLARRVAADNFHLDVGLLGTKAILGALSDNGQADVAYRLAAQETFPSWGWWMANGATTLYENWPIDAKSDISLNHIMFGEIGAWLYKGLSGIRPDPQQPGFKNVLLAPHFVAGLAHFEATHQGPYGTIRSAWRRVGAGVAYAATVPPGATATLTLPVPAGQAVYEGGQPLGPSGPGIRLRQATAQLRQYQLAAGTYQLAIK